MLLFNGRKADLYLNKVDFRFTLEKTFNLYLFISIDQVAIYLYLIHFKRNKGHNLTDKGEDEDIAEQVYFERSLNLQKREINGLSTNKAKLKAAFQKEKST